MTKLTNEVTGDRNQQTVSSPAIENKSASFERTLARRMALIFVVVGVVFAIVRHNEPAFVGLGIALLVASLSLLAGEETHPSLLGLGMIGMAVVLATIGEFAQPDWHMESADFAVLAIGSASAGLAQVFWDNRRAEPREWLQKASGVIAFGGILLFGAVYLLDTADRLASPLGIVVGEALGAFAELAGEKWRLRLSFPAIAAMAAIISSYYGIRIHLVQVQFTIWWLVSRSNWPVTVGTVVMFAACIIQRLKWKETLQVTLFTLIVIWTIRAFWVAVGIAGR
jgi:hypothetical protein